MASFNSAFAEVGTFVKSTIRGRRYWYFDERCHTGGYLRYVGPETPDLLGHIRLHRRSHDDLAARHMLVSKLVKFGQLHRPAHEAGEIILALSKVGTFRLRA